MEMPKSDGIKSTVMALRQTEGRKEGRCSETDFRGQHT